MPAYKEASGTWCARFYTSDYIMAIVPKRRKEVLKQKEKLSNMRESFSPKPHFLFPCHSRAYMSFI